MGKARLPREIERILPPELVHVIYSFLPHVEKTKPPSPGLQKELERLQKGAKNTAMYLKGLDDFILK